MADHTEIALRAVNKALTDVIAPTLDPKDPLAHEQLRLVVDYINFLRQRLDWLGPRARFELQQAVDLAAVLLPLAAPAPSPIRQDLEASLAQGRAVLDAPASASPTLATATATINAAVRRLVRAAAHFDVEARRAIEKTVLLASATQTLFERAWYAPLGLEPAPGELPPLTKLL